MADDGLVLVGLRTQFYRDNYRRIVIIFLLSVLINIGLGSIFFYKWTHPPLPKYFPTSLNGRITPQYPLEQPGISDESMLQWATQSILAAYNYNYLTWRQDLQAASQFFTDTGWTRFQTALQDSQVIDTVVSHKWIVTSSATQAPQILQRGVVTGVYPEPRYAWQVKTAINVQFVGDRDFVEKTFTITMTIVRVSTLNAPRGIGIEQIIVEENK